MFQSLIIEGYRGFPRLEVEGLGRVNLIVGKNNSGKSSVLEALYLLVCDDVPGGIWRICRRRGEGSSEDDPRRAEGGVEVSHLFHGHELKRGTGFRIQGRNATSVQVLSVRIDEPSLEERDEAFSNLFENDNPLRSLLALQIQSSNSPDTRPILLTEAGGMRTREVEWARRKPLRTNLRVSTNVQYVATESVDTVQLLRLWDRIQLTPHEGRVLEAVRFIDGGIEQIRAVGSAATYRDPGSFIVKLSGHDRPVPLGSLGDGVRRLLALAIGITQCAGGMLFVDEIDTGLHHSVMSAMWGLIQRAAEEFDVQVFATTHSHDCVRALATVCDDNPASTGRVSIQRVERGRAKAIPFSEDEIRIVAEQRLEIR